MEDNYSKDFVIRMIVRYGDIEEVILDGFDMDLFIISNGAVISLNKGFARLSLNEVLEIAEQLEMTPHDIDLFLQ